MRLPAATVGLGELTRPATIKRVYSRVDGLKGRFTHWLDVFEQPNVFTGPTVYSRHRILASRQNHRCAAEAAVDQDFLDSLYATLPAWAPGSKFLWQAEW